MLTSNREVTGLQATGVQRSYWQIGFPSRCRIPRLRVVQTGGALDPFRVKIFNSRRPTESGSQSSGGAAEDGNYEASPEVYQVGPTVDGANGIARWDLEQGHLFENSDGDSVVTREHFAYVEIACEGSGAKTFDLALGLDMGER